MPNTPDRAALAERLRKAAVVYHELIDTYRVIGFARSATGCESLAADLHAAAAALDARRERDEVRQLVAWFDELVDTIRGQRDAAEATVQNVRAVLNEIDCRIEHGADSNGHLQAIHALLRRALDGEAMAVWYAALIRERDEAVARAERAECERDEANARAGLQKARDTELLIEADRTILQLRDGNAAKLARAERAEARAEAAEATVRALRELCGSVFRDLDHVAEWLSVHDNSHDHYITVHTVAARLLYAATGEGVAT